jgi:glycosyltransferase involved in cell wall biosynthesis
MSAGNDGRSKPLITIVIPTLNSRNVIDKALNSILAQSYREFEVILSDGGSQDGTVEHAMGRLQQASIGVRTIIAPGSGIYGSMNLAGRIARGEWIYYIGSDDSLYAPETLQWLSPYLRNTRADVVHGVAWIENPGYMYGGEFPLHRLIKRNANHQAMFFRVRALRSHRIAYNETYRIYSDWDHNFQLLAKLRFHYIALPVVSFGCEGLSSRVVDSEFLRDKEANAIQYFGIRSYWMLPLDRLALGCAVRPSQRKSWLLLATRGVRSPIAWLSRRSPFRARASSSGAAHRPASRPVNFVP